MYFWKSGEPSNFPKTESINALNISFQEYSTGIYLVVLKYKNGDEKTIKIIKHWKWVVNWWVQEGFTKIKQFESDER